MNIIGGTSPQEKARFTKPKTKTAIRIVENGDGTHRAEIFTRIASWQLVNAEAAKGLIIIHGTKLKMMFDRFPDLFTDDKRQNEKAQQR